MAPQEKCYSDKEVVDGIIAGNNTITQWFFCTKCKSIIYYIYTRVTDCKYQPEEILNSLYLYLSENHWHKLRQFDFRSKLTTWFSVVGIRYFKKIMDGVIEMNSIDTLYSCQDTSESTPEKTEATIDVHDALKRMPNERYRQVIIALDLQEKAPEDLAREMKISTANLYNIHRRALQQLRQIMV